MIARAPASASISAEMSPVWAPDSFGWQSCAPTASAFERRAFSANSATRVAGGHTRTSTLPARSEAPASIASNSAEEDFRPFIFQLPAISGRMASVIGVSRKYSAHALAERGDHFQCGPCKLVLRMLPTELHAVNSMVRPEGSRERLLMRTAAARRAGQQIYPSWPNRCSRICCTEEPAHPG